MKKEYMKPTMRVVKTQKRVHILAGSGESTPPDTTNYNDWLQ